MAINVLGISAFYHDSAAALVSEGEIIAAVQEERFSRKKFDPRFPVNAINYCLEEAFIEPDELDAIVFYDNPILTIDRVLKSIITTAPNSFEQWRKAAKSILGVKLFIEEYIRNTLKTDTIILFTKHHPAHAASAFYPSPFKESAFLTVDGVGEWETTTYGVGNDEGIQTSKKIDYPHSLGLLYSTFTYYTGFKVNSGEYKLMGLAPYGEPGYVKLIKDKLINILEDGSFQLNTEYFGFLDSIYMINDKFNSLFDGEPRKPEEKITKKDADIAASIQKVIEEVILKLAKNIKKETKMSNLVLAGGVALNSVASGLLLKENIFSKVWIQPAAGDAGGALGAAFLVTHEYFQVPRRYNNGRDLMKGAFLGPRFSMKEITAFLEKDSIPYYREANKNHLYKKIAKIIDEGKIIGYFSGRMEYGPRALGARSIIGDPRNVETQVTMNLKIKYRESFRPFAPSVLIDKSSDYFEIKDESPYMLFVVPVNKERCNNNFSIKLEGDDIDLLEIVRKKRSDIPAVTHVDNSARIQTVHPDDKPGYYKLIKEFETLTGYGVVVNTSFNVRGEPIVCTPQDAYVCFMNTEMDVLILEDCILYKKEQPKVNMDIDKLLKNDSIVMEEDTVKSSKKIEREIDKFYRNEIIILSSKLKEKNIHFFSLQPEMNKLSYFIQIDKNEKNIIDFSEITLSEALIDIWNQDNISGLLQLIKPLLSLAEKLKKENILQTEEISPYIYAMF